MTARAAAVATRRSAAPRTRELVLDLPRRAERIYNRCNERDLFTAQVHGIVEALVDAVHLEPALATSRWLWFAALHACGKAKA